MLVRRLIFFLNFIMFEVSEIIIFFLIWGLLYIPSL